MISLMASKLKIGTCGFFGPRKRYYRLFNVIEVQQTFYHPMPEWARNWRTEAPEEFEFTTKAWQLITHEPFSPTYRRLRFKMTPGMRNKYGNFKQTPEVFEAWEKTKEVAKILGSRIIIFQCPSSFEPTEENRENLRAFFKKIGREDYLLGWEPRGRWGAKEIKALCAELDLLHVVDPFRSKKLHGGIDYYRLHGLGPDIYDYNYGSEDLMRLKRLVNGRRDCYFMFNNTYMRENAIEFMRLTGLKPPSKPQP